MSTDPTLPAPEVVLHEERLRMDVVRVPVERVVLRRRIVTETRQVEVTVRREELEVSRVPVADGAGMSGTPPTAPTVIVLSEEVPVVQVHTRPYEQVTVHVETTTTQQAVSGTVSHEEVEVTGQHGRLR